MNRTIFGGIAVFVVLLAVAVMGGQNDANAGWGCGGCGGLFSGHHNRCHGGLIARIRARHACHSDCGGAPDCGGVSDCGGGCHGGGLFARLRARRCHGASTCCGVPTPPPCCEPAPEPCCEPAPCGDCGAAPCGDCGGSPCGEVPCGEMIVEPACGVPTYDAPMEVPMEAQPGAPSEPPAEPSATEVPEVPAIQ